MMKFIDSLSERIGRAVSWLTVALVLVVCYDVFARYVLKHSSAAMPEIEWHLFSVIFLMGSPYTLRHNRHVRIDILYDRLPKRGRALVDIAGTLFFLLPFAILVIWTSREFVANSFIMGETSPDPGGLPARYLLKACIPVAFLLVLLQGASNAVKSFRTLTGGQTGREERTHD